MSLLMRSIEYVQTIEFVASFCAVCSTPDATHVLDVKVKNVEQLQKIHTCAECAVSILARTADVKYIVR